MHAIVTYVVRTFFYALFSVWFHSQITNMCAHHNSKRISWFCVFLLLFHILHHLVKSHRIISMKTPILNHAKVTQSFESFEYTYHSVLFFRFAFWIMQVYVNQMDDAHFFSFVDGFVPRVKERRSDGAMKEAWEKKRKITLFPLCTLNVSHKL